MGKLKGVGIGAGYFSQFHYDSWQRSETASMAALYDIDPGNAQRISKKYGIEKIYDRIDAMLERERPDFVDIITPPDTHEAICTQVAEYGIPIICQKPFGGNLKTARRIVRFCEEKKVRLIVHENFRFQPWFREIKRQLDLGRLGDTLHTLHFRLRTGDGWQKDAYMGRQPYFRTMERLFVHETGIHYIDTFRYLAGEIEKVYAKMGHLNNNIRGEDLAWIHFEFKNGALGMLDANRYNENNAKDPRYTFGEMWIEGNGGGIRLHSDGSLMYKALGTPEAQIPYRKGTIGFAGDCVHAAQEHYIQSIRLGNPSESDAGDYLQNLRIEEAVYQADSLGSPVHLDKYDPLP